MLIFILINFQYLQKAVFSFEKGLNCQNQSSSGSLHPVKKLPPPHYCYLKNPEPAGLQLFKKETPMQVFSCGICETFKNTGGCF